MDKVEKLDNLQFIVTELVGSIRENIIEENTIKNENIDYLTTKVQKLNSCNSQFFTAGYNILIIKQIMTTLLDIVKEQDKCIRELESKNQHLPCQKH
jgi:hypothetical protein